MPVTDRIAALILAAGCSSRMGTLKPLLPFGRLTALEQAVDRLQRGGITDIRVVIGHVGAQIRAALPRLPARWIENPDYQQGMLSSVLAGVAALRDEAEAFLLLPVDMPLVSPETIAELLTARRRRPAPVIYPIFRKQRGHPPLIDLSCIPPETSPYIPGGLRTLLQTCRQQALEIPVNDPAILLDCDTPVDYQRLLQYMLNPERQPGNQHYWGQVQPF